jgi:hypothetical protein
VTADAYAALGYTAAVLVLLGCCAYWLSVREGSERDGRCSYRVRAARYHLTRLRAARRMRGPLPWWDQGVPYDRFQWDAVLDTWDTPPARPERTRT